MENDRELYKLLASLLEYPSGDYAGRARRCLELARELRPGVAERLAAFVGFVESSPQARLEESFSAAFDLQPAFCPYVGYHLVGDNPKRGMLMAKLQEVYRSRGFEWGSELPDHVSVMLRFLSTLDDGPEAQELVEVALVPAFGKMAGASKDGSGGFALLVQAASLVMSNE